MSDNPCLEVAGVDRAWMLSAGGDGKHGPRSGARSTPVSSLMSAGELKSILFDCLAVQYLLDMSCGLLRPIATT